MISGELVLDNNLPQQQTVTAIGISTHDASAKHASLHTANCTAKRKNE
jgi:hypothetical protein